MYYISVNWGIIKRLTAASRIPRIYTCTSLIFTLPAGTVVAPVHLHKQKYCLPDSSCVAPLRQDDMWQIKEKTPLRLIGISLSPPFGDAREAFSSCLSEQRCKIHSLNSFHQWCPHQYQTHILCHRHLLQDIEFKICDKSTVLGECLYFTPLKIWLSWEQNEKEK